MSISKYIPWWVKIAAKILLSRLPVDYKLWKQLSLFQHGYMEHPSYAYQVFKQHFDKVGEFKTGFVSLEIGPGDSLLSAIVGQAFGGSASYLVDVGAFVSRDVKPYREMVCFLSDKGLPTINISSLNSLEEILAAYCATYKNNGLSSLREIPTQSVDFIWSQAVLEHIRQAEFLETMQELRRIIRKNGVCSHRVDLRDHLGGSLNNLRFPKYLWESDFMANSGFYTNRIHYYQMINLFQQANFDVKVIKVERWKKLPTPKTKFSKEFQSLSDEELCVSGFDVVLKPV
ncbi:MAG: class I SAM-dependent methyltransferase [Symploca sp. SIO3C6]|uniref:Class I SAM-dependent methyltransferase n=1 Tax=Symploca sp. SIO1C4 TaxID=2607765 RepID=A0A6B3N4N0_9CYAN|nr:class I SAM-dependent methyltransferase [Symploca sp. SIO3C6]NER26490.1 class I SAM-dependent methyltransferase [Symploca sp. SIO1C4]